MYASIFPGYFLHLVTFKLALRTCLAWELIPRHAHALECVDIRYNGTQSQHSEVGCSKIPQEVPALLSLPSNGLGSPVWIIMTGTTTQLRGYNRLISKIVPLTAASRSADLIPYMVVSTLTQSISRPPSHNYVHQLHSMSDVHQADDKV